MNRQSLSLSEAAERLNMNRSTLLRWVHQGRLSAEGGGRDGFRIRPEDLEDLLHRHYGGLRRALLTAATSCRTGAERLVDHARLQEDAGEHEQALGLAKELERAAGAAVMASEHYGDLMGFYPPNNAPVGVGAIREVHVWVPYHEASSELRAAFTAVGYRQGALRSASPADMPTDWFCDDHQDYVHPDELGVTCGEGIEPMPVCPRASCPGRGWVRVHPLPKVPDPRLRGLPPIGRPPRKRPR